MFEDVDDVEVDEVYDVDDVDELASLVLRSCRERVLVARRDPSGVRVSRGK